MRITMLTLSASPEGVLEAGRTYDVPSDLTRERARQLLDAGCAIEEGRRPAADQEPGAGGQDNDAPSLEARTVAQLRAYAAENDIDLGPAKSKAEVLAAIRAAETGESEPPAGPQEPPPGGGD